MSEERNKRNHAETGLDDFELGPVVGEALRDFRVSVQAWSDAAYHRPRPAVAVAHRTAWRRSVTWVLSLALSLGMVGTAGWEHHHQNEIARQHEQQQREQERRRQLAEQQAVAEQQARAQQHAQDSEDLLAKVDSDVSREVPAAMEPLAQLMTDDDIR